MISLGLHIDMRKAACGTPVSCVSLSQKSVADMFRSVSPWRLNTQVSYLGLGSSWIRYDVKTYAALVVVDTEQSSYGRAAQRMCVAACLHLVFHPLALVWPSASPKRKFSLRRHIQSTK